MMQSRPAPLVAWHAVSTPSPVVPGAAARTSQKRCHFLGAPCGHAVLGSRQGRRLVRSACAASTTLPSLVEEAITDDSLILGPPTTLLLGEDEEEHSAAAASTDAAASISSDSPEEGQPTTFFNLGVDSLLVSGLRSQGILAPSPIQAAAIPAVLAGGNCALQSFTGSGKTLAYLLPVMTLALARADEELRQRNGQVSVQAVVVSPSQELAMQIVRVAQSLLPPAGRDMVQQVIGGANAKRQHEALSLRRPALVVGTPGRLSEMVRLGWLRLHQCRILVLDEADQLLAPTFADDMSHVLEHTGKKLDSSLKQTVMASATMTQGVLAKAVRWCPDARLITAAPLPPVAPPPPSPSALRAATAAAAALAADGGPEAAAAAAAPPAWGWGAKGWDGSASPFAVRTLGSAGGVTPDGDVPPLPPHVLHFYVVSEPQHKADVLRRLVHARAIQRALVFVNFQQRARDIQFRLEGRGMKAAALHGEMPKLQRASVLEGFRKGRSRVLVVSDVASRGLDVAECDAVVHLELPSGPPHYAHRSGRTGRMGAPGAVISIVSPAEVYVVEKLGKQLGVPILEAHLLNGQMLLGAAPAQARSGRRGGSKEDEEDEDREEDARRVAPSEREETGSSSSSSSSPRSTTADGKPTRRTRKGEQTAPEAAVEAVSAALEASAASEDEPSFNPLMSPLSPQYRLFNSEEGMPGATASSTSARSTASGAVREAAVPLRREQQPRAASLPAAEAAAVARSLPAALKEAAGEAVQKSEDAVAVVKAQKRSLLEVFSESMKLTPADAAPASSAAALAPAKAVRSPAAVASAAPRQTARITVGEPQASSSSSSSGSSSSSSAPLASSSRAAMAAAAAAAAAMTPLRRLKRGVAPARGTASSNQDKEDDDDSDDDDDNEVDDATFDAALSRGMMAASAASTARRSKSSSRGSSRGSNGGRGADAEEAGPSGGSPSATASALRRELRELVEEKARLKPEAERAAGPKAARGRK